MQEYLEMWQRYFDFGGRSSVRAYWMAFLFNFIVGIVLGIIVNVTGITLISSVYSLAGMIPGLALCVRRLRDAGCHWANLFWPCLPLVGTIILIVKLCKPSK